MDFSSLLLVLILIVTILYWFLTKTYNHWQKQNIPCAPNPIPGFGHMKDIIFLKENSAILADRLYKSTDASLIGFYFLRRPGIVVRDPELIKSILQTNFTSFSSNLLHFNENLDPIVAKHPSFTSDLHLWKLTRSRTANTLTGKKLRSIFIIAQDVCDKKMNIYIERKIQDNIGSYECELKDFFSKYTGEIVANAAFAIEGQCFDDNPDERAFVNIVKNVFTPSFFNGLKLALLTYLPELANLLRLKFFEEKTEKQLKYIIKDILNRRKDMANPPEDYFQFCVDVNSIDDIDTIIADIIIFYGDVYETSSLSLSLVFYYLSKNEKIQEKLRTHVNSVLSENNGEISFDSLKNMNYLDQVIQETMRMTAPAGTVMKLCTKEITLEGSDGLKCRLHPNDVIFIPIMGLHNDRKYWPNPEIFDPDRFSPENQTNRHKYVHIPFSEGPRMCVGMRLGLMLIKLATVKLLTEFKIERSTKTKEPFEFDPNSIITNVKGGLWAKFEKLN